MAGEAAERTCPKCGKTFKTDGAWFVKHAMKCQGKPARSRIEGGEGTPIEEPELELEKEPALVVGPRKTRKTRRATIVASKPRQKAARRPVRPRKKKTGRELALIPPAALVIPVLPSARLTFLDQARAARDRLDVAIAAIEAIG